MTSLINSFINQNEAVIEFLEHTRKYHKEVDQVMPQYNDFLQRAKFNPALGAVYANILQLSNDEDVYSQYQLEDIARLFESLVKLQEYNLDTYVEAANFEYAVMDNNELARKIAEAGIANAQEKIEELQRLLHKMSR